MAQEIADSKLLDTWSSGGNIVEPDSAKIIEGWQLGEQPPHEYMNWLQNTFGSKLNHILKNGVANWNNETEYLAGSSVQHSGNVWLCKTTNTNSEPTDSNKNWDKIPSLENLALTVNTINDFPTSATTGDTCIVKDLNRGGIFVYDSTKVSEDNQGTNFNGWVRQYNGAVNVEWFGAKGDGNPSNGSANSIIFSYVVNNFNNITIGDGEFYISSEIFKSESFECPIISGNGNSTVIKNTDTFIGESLFHIRGGSGGSSNGILKNITFRPTTDDLISITFNNQNFCKVDSCKFVGGIGIRMLNSDNGFTEYCTAENSDFNCQQVIKYERAVGATQKSFNGSGLLNCTINERAATDKATVEIGAGCVPYNAPMDLMIWKRTVIYPIIQNNSSLPNVIFYGNIKVEMFTVGSTKIADGVRSIYLAGNTLVWGPRVVTGLCILVDRIESQTDGNVAVLKKTSRHNFTIDSTLYKMALPISEDGVPYNISIQLTAANYDYLYMLIVSRRSSLLEVAISEVRRLQSFNNVGYAGITFSSVDNQLTINNNYPSGVVTARVSVKQLGAPSQLL